MSPLQRRRTRTMVRAVVHALILLVVIGMVLGGAATALAAPPSAPGGPNDLSAPGGTGAGRDAVAPLPSALAGAGAHSAPGAPGARGAEGGSGGPAPTIVLAASNLTWADLSVLAREPDSAQDAATVLAFARANEPVNLVTRSTGATTSLSDGWTTLGAGTRMGWQHDPAPRLEPSHRSPGALARTLRERGLSVSASGGLARQAVSPLTTWSHQEHSWAQEDPEPRQAAVASTADLTLIDTTPQGPIGDADQLASLAAGLRGALSRGDARVLVVSLADDDDPGPQLAVLPAGTAGEHGRSAGLIIGDSTHRPGLIQITDLAPTLIEALTGSTAPGFEGRALSLPEGPTSAGALGSTGRAPASAAPPGPADPTGPTESAEPPASPAPAAATVPPDPRLGVLADDALHARASLLATVPTSALLIVAVLSLLGGAAPLLRAPLAGPETPGSRRRLLRWVRAGALAVASLPVGALLSNLLPWWRLGDRDGQATIYAVPAAALATLVMGGAVLGLLLGADTAARRLLARLAAPAPREARPGPGRPGGAEQAPQRHGHRRRPGGLPPTGVLVGCSLAGATSLGWLVDAATGAHLSFNGVLGMNAVVAGRFYGMSNTGFALAAGALVVLIAVVWDLAGRTVPAALAAVAVLGGAALVLDGAPQLGADVGGALTLVPALAALAAGLAGWRLGWRRWAVIGVLTCGAVAGFAALDLARTPGQRTHLGRFAEQVLNGSALEPLARKAYALVGPFLSSPLALGGLLAAVLAGAVLVLRGRYELRLWRRGESPYAWLTREVAMPPAWLRPALRSLGVLTVVAVLLNDSGVTMAGFILVGAAPIALALALVPSTAGTADAMDVMDAMDTADAMGADGY